MSRFWLGSRDGMPELLERDALNDFPETPYWISQIEDRWHETVDFHSRRIYSNNATAEIRANGTFQRVVSPGRSSIRMRSPRVDAGRAS